MITVLYPTYLPAVYKIVDRVCRQYSSEIIVDFTDLEGYQLLTSLDECREEEALEYLSRYSSLFSIRHENEE